MLKKILAACALIMGTNVVFADPGAYIGANVGYANIENWWTGSLALTINGGYAFNNYFATEVGGTWINPIGNTYPSNSSMSGSYSQSQSFVDVAAKGSIPLSPIFNLYGKIGLGAAFTGNCATSGPNATWTQPPTGVSPGLYMSLGGEFNISQHFDLTAEDYGLAVFGNNNSGNINVFGVGAKYKF